MNLNQIKERPEFENYIKQKLLGEGSFGKAYLVKRASDGLLCCMKMIDIHKMSDKERKEVVQESRLLQALSHPNIVEFIENHDKIIKLCNNLQTINENQKKIYKKQLYD